MLTCSACGQIAPLCDACLESLTSQLGGVARARGYAWGRAVRAVAPGQPWPAYETSERVQAIARRKVEDVHCHDDRLREVLARLCAETARGAYEAGEAVPGAVAFRYQRLM